MNPYVDFREERHASEEAPASREERVRGYVTGLMVTLDNIDKMLSMLEQRLSFVMNAGSDQHPAIPPITPSPDDSPLATDLARLLQGETNTKDRIEYILFNLQI